MALLSLVTNVGREPSFTGDHCKEVLLSQLTSVRGSFSIDNKCKGSFCHCPPIWGEALLY